VRWIASVRCAPWPGPPGNDARGQSWRLAAVLISGKTGPVCALLHRHLSVHKRIV
jgi:hypothetical protein